MEPWQKFIIYAIYGFYYKGTDDRVIQRAYILISRKNGKTALCSALALYHLLMGENGQEVVCGANSKDQATLLKESTEKFINKLPKPIKNNLHTFRSLITFKQKNDIITCNRHINIITDIYVLHTGQPIFFSCRGSHEGEISRHTGFG